VKLAYAEGTTDPTLEGEYDRAGTANSAGFQIGIPLRIFDRNQGEKARTEIDIKRNQRLVEATRAQIFNDVDSAYVTLVSSVNLLRPYKGHYLAQATRVRDIVTFSYERGGAALLDFLQAEQDYRSVQLNYVSLVGAYLTAAAQLNLAVGQEVIP
jgi:cobalt-zinc-cadmium efflux system outer membrane protein